MKEVTKDVLVDCATRLMFEMEDSEYELLTEEFDTIKQQLGLIGKIEGVDEYTPMTFPYPVFTTFLREDEPTEPLAKEDVLKNAGSVQDGQIKLPKVVN